MSKIRFSLAVLSTLTLQAESLSEAFNGTEVDGYLRGAYQSHNVNDDKTYKDGAIGGKLHFETGAYYGVSLGASAYASKAIFKHDNKGLIPFRGDNHDSYAILGEAYLKATFGNSMLTVGRQEIETPFAQVDDIGMTPNSFEAVIFENKGIEDTSIFLGHVQRMAGVDAEVIDDFTNVNGSKHMQVLGVTYEGIKDVDISTWYYHLKDAEIESIVYVEGNYEKELGNTTFGAGIQYAKQRYHVGNDATVYGGTLSATENRLGLTVTTAYTKVKDNAATSGFGGGPFYSNSEYLILDNAGKDAKAKWIGIEFDASVVGMTGFNMGIGKITLETETKKEASEVDFVASYELNKEMEVHLVYSDLKGINVAEDDAKHLRVFANYNF